MLSIKQVKAIELLVYKGLTQDEVSQVIKVHRNTITNWKKDEAFFEALEIANRKNLKIAAIIALRTMIGLLTSQNEETRFKASKDILDRTEYKDTESIVLNINNNSLEDYFGNI